MKTEKIRQAFLEYFQIRGHEIVPSSSLVPGNDPTLLFTNAGMVQFKDVFLGLEKRPYTRAASSQMCVRAGGKHNDLENVGYTARHHTFFEMLGNFSFGDYFKREAIEYAWDFLTKTLKLSPERLWVTVYEKDAETADIWLNDMKIDPKRFSRCGEKDNFWSMGDTGPCGPCTEIYYDHGSSIPGTPPGAPDEFGDRYVEIWNLVFMQYDRSSDGTLTPLPKPSVDTGMGLERVAAVMQGVHSNYEIDIFQHLIRAIAKLASVTDLENKSLRVIADHIRAVSFLIASGVFPSNEGRGYVLRRICRRAIRHGHKLGFQAPFFYKLLSPLIEVMGKAYPELKDKKDNIEKAIHQEELQFARTLDQGLKILEDAFLKVKDNTLPGETVFRLYDTYGFPVDLTADMARERGMSVDMDGFETAMSIQRTRAREASQFSMQISDRIDVAHATEFTGYETLDEEAEVLALFFNGEPVTKLEKGDEAIVILDHTPFYAEAGGQVGDQGILEFRDGEFEVRNTKKTGQAHAHYGVVKEGSLHLKSMVRAIVDKKKRKNTALNHSATHLLHAALRQLLGSHAQQKGSLVEPDRLRFDFSHPEALTLEQIRTVERMVNEQIRLNSDVVTEIMPAEKAFESGAVALFGEKYDKEKPLRVLRMGGDFSVELCGGTHVHRTGDIGLFKITSESGVASGVRRIEAVTGERAMAILDKMQTSMDALSSTLKCKPEEMEIKIQQLVTKNKQLEKELQQAKMKMISGGGSETASLTPRDIGAVKVLAQEIPDADQKTLRDMIDRLKSQHQIGVFILASIVDQKVILVAGVTKTAIEKHALHAGDLIKEVARQVGGQGGGRPDMAQAGGTDPSRLKEALDWVYQEIESRLKNS